MSIQRNDDVVFSFNATLLNYSMAGKQIAYLRLQTSPTKVRHYFPDLFTDFSCSLGPWSPEQRTVRVTFSGRVHLPIYKDGELVAITCENRNGRRFTIRFNEYTDLLYTNLTDERSAA